jgi:hypothetical protein
LKAKSLICVHPRVIVAGTGFFWSVSQVIKPRMDTDEHGLKAKSLICVHPRVIVAGTGFFWSVSRIIKPRMDTD